MSNISGLAELFQNIQSVKSDLDREVSRAVRATAQAIREDAIKSIAAHQSQGREYTRGGVTHKASKAGHAPNQDRGTLTRNIRVTMNDDLTADVTSNAPYSEALEFGTTNMQARPFMTPASEGQRKKHAERLQKAAKNALSRGAA